MGLISPDEVVTTIILVIPGFVSLSLMLGAVGIARKVEFSEYLVWSFFLSGLIDLVIIIWLGLPLPPSSDQFFAAIATWPRALALPALVVAVAIGGAFLLRLDLPRGLQKLVWIKAKSRRIPSLVWDDSLKVHFDQWIIAETTDGRRILGLLLRYSTGEESREIYLAHPRLIVSEEDGTQKRFPLGEAILLNESNLLSIRFLTKPTGFTVLPPTNDADERSAKGTPSSQGQK